MTFEKEYKKLNKAQREAVETLTGPVMVVAGPGTGKTQVLSMRIANILNKTDIKADAILCLTFTNSAVDAMKARLKQYIGEAGEEVNVSTFHSFGMQIIEKYYPALGLNIAPKLLDDADTAILFDEVLGSNDWEYLRPRANRSRYFSDLRSLISLLKRERITSNFFLSELEQEIKTLRQSTLKKDFQKIESLERSREVIRFFNQYEKTKREKNVLDYDDVLENLVKIMEISLDAAFDMREKYLYVLVDEHQDSSRVQNEFLATVWGKVEGADIFVVGDDRQLIYGFSGASIDHFQGFKRTWKDAKLITLVDNYRSTQVILDASHALLQSIMTTDKLKSQNMEHHPIRLLEAKSPEDEILAATLDIKEKIKEGVKAGDCAILVPKNAEVRSALAILHENNLPVSVLDALNLFEQEEAIEFLRVLKIISDPDDTTTLPRSFFDKSSGITPLEAHVYIASHNESKTVKIWLEKLSKWQETAKNTNLVKLLEIIGKVLFNKESNKLVSGKEILSTILALAEKEKAKNKNITLKEFVPFIERLQSYDEHIPLIMKEKDGIKVLTLHSAKGLEFDYVWIAHMDEGGLSGGKKAGFVLPEAIAEKVIERDVDRVKRKLYVAITRAKRFCTLSYARYSNRGTEQEVAKIIADLPEEVFSRRKVKDSRPSRVKRKNYSSELVKLVSEKYKDRNVSASLLNNFFECPWKWYFRNLLQLPEEKSESLEFGSAVHKAIDKILSTKGGSASGGNITKMIADLGLDKEVARIVSRWAKNRLPDITEKRENEKSVSMKDKKFPHLNIYGKVDLIEYLATQELRVTDFKTGSVRKKSDIEKLDEEGRMSGNLRQLTMYSYLLENTSKMNVRESRLEFLEAKNPKESIYDRVITPTEIELLVKDIEDYDELIKSGKWSERSCYYNSYGKNTVCEYCKLAEIYK